MKKFISILLIAMTLLSLAACQSGDPATTAANGGNKEPKELVLADTYTAITANANMPEMWKVDNDLLLDPGPAVQAVGSISVRQQHAG